MVVMVFTLIMAYLIGSIPTAMIVSRILTGADIRRIGDGNMGARNVTRSLGVGPGIIVGGADFCKGAGAVLLARSMGGTSVLQLAAGAAVVLGHDFPILAGFRGGQGLAASLGVLTVLLPMQTLWGLLIFGSAFLVFRNFDLSAGLGLGLIVWLTWRADRSIGYVVYAALLFVSVGIKKWIDLPRHEAIKRMRIAKAPGQLTDNGGLNNGVHLNHLPK
jgi:glycerol-3-phosphate acyltransferase PlsY